MQDSSISQDQEVRCFISILALVQSIPTSRRQCLLSLSCLEFFQLYSTSAVRS